MKKVLLLLACSLVLIQCKEREKPVEEPVQKPIIEEDIEDEPLELTLSNFDGFTIGNGVRMRSKADLKSEKVAELPHGMLVKILDETSRKSITKGFDCDDYGYPWLKVKTADGQEGWIFGKFLNKIPKKAIDKKVNNFQGKTFKFKDEPFIFGFGIDYSYPMMDDEGLTLCEDMTTLFLYKEGEETIRPIFAKTMKGRDWKLTSHKNGYWQLENSDGAAEDLHTFLQILYGVRLKYEASFQAGSARRGTIEITQKNGKFYAHYTTLAKE